METALFFDTFPLQCCIAYGAESLLEVGTFVGLSSFNDEPKFRLYPQDAIGELRLSGGGPQVDIGV